MEGYRSERMNGIAFLGAGKCAHKNELMMGRKS
jgi:hypothetical protein